MQATKKRYVIRNIVSGLLVPHTEFDSYEEASLWISLGDAPAQHFAVEIVRTEEDDE